MRYAWRMIIGLGVVLGITGCVTTNVPAPRMHTLDRFDRGSQLVNQAFQHYRHYSRGSFEQLVADDFGPMRVDFISTVERNFYGMQIIDAQYYLNSVQEQGDALVVNITWEKKMQPRTSSQQQLTRGRCDLVFKTYEETWRLQQIRGDNPFV